MPSSTFGKPALVSTNGKEPEVVRRTPATVALLVGPEGGWDVAECGLARAAGMRLLSLGGRTLRADAVAVAALSVLQFLWDQPC